MSISTVKGAIGKEELKKTYVHEHLCIDLSYVKGDEDTNLNNVEEIIEELKNSTVNSIVEVTNMGMGRNIEILKYISEKTDINIIPSTGFYKEPFLPKEIYEMNYKDIGKIIVREIIDGIDGTNIKAHVIGEVGTSKDEIKPMELKVLQSAIYGHLETGHPIFTHTSLGTTAPSTPASWCRHTPFTFIDLPLRAKPLLALKSRVRSPTLNSLASIRLPLLSNSVFRVYR